ncbi:LysR family transcriptional regulator [Paraburkholderia graminis]|uniref:LysR family transcriptional regulator n=1 Tax=Paraburkholderia graminis TaxID=60548 RepID=UPI002790D549|nr:LysR substrate-binding domain-containing protein [Paraburkholderia graminis]MDQ0625945.1 DNA-binding transcriptional LysR family regulator [Paraburkholderia graminis]
MRYELTDLEVFLAVAEEGSVTRGAERCHLAPSSASLRIKGFEDVIGVPLLVRLARGVAPTAAGRIVMEHARRCVAQLEQMNADLLPFTKGLVGHVTLFANNNAISSHLPDDLARFFASFPNVRISLEERLSHDIVAAVASGRADLGVVALEADHPELVFHPYREDELVIVAARSDPFADRKRIAFAECLGRSFISLQPGAALHTFVMNHASALGGRLDVRVQVSSYGAIVKLVGSGAGIGIVAKSAIDGDAAQNVAVVALAEPWARRDLRVCVLRNAPVINPFRDRLLETLTAGQEIAGATAK